jgi:hypothetical protein
MALARGRVPPREEGDPLDGTRLPAFSGVSPMSLQATAIVLVMDKLGIAHALVPVRSLPARGS